MFGKKDESQKEQERAENEAISSIIDKQMLITGDIDFQGKTRIDGTIKGNIRGEHLVLSESGMVTGDITACSLNCFGKLEGNVRANLVTARKNCVIHGRLEAASLAVEPGAVIDGEIRAAIGEITTAPVKRPTMENTPSGDNLEKN